MPYRIQQRFYFQIAGQDEPAYMWVDISVRSDGGIGVGVSAAYPVLLRALEDAHRIDNPNPVRVVDVMGKVIVDLTDLVPVEDCNNE